LNMLTLGGDPSREAIANLTRGTLEGKPARYEGTYKSQTGRKITQIQALLAPIHGPAGILGGIGIVEDVSDRKRIEAGLARADRMASIGTLAAGVAHEINNPLVYVTLGLELIERELQHLRSRGQAPSGWAIVEVEDTGAGIEPWKMDRIFEPFWTDKPVGVGTGLGLSIVHGIVSALGGDIEVQSTPGRGTTFRVTLPVQGARAAEGAPPPPLARSEPGRRPRVLLIDDEAHLGVTLSVGLRQEADVTSVRS